VVHIPHSRSFPLLRTATAGASNLLGTQIPRGLQLRIEKCPPFCFGYGSGSAHPSSLIQSIDPPDGRPSLPPGVALHPAPLPRPTTGLPPAAASHRLAAAAAATSSPSRPPSPTTSRHSLADAPPSSSYRPRDTSCTSAHRGSSRRCSAARSHRTE
jgi:hypothetical protein